MSYFDELAKAMTWLGEQTDTIFLGQSVAYPGNSIFNTLSGVPMEKRLELPVAEELQLGISTGLALAGRTVISIFPRMDFLMCCMNQLVNHLDKNIYPLKGKVIIRTAIGATKPMHPGVQHCGDYTEGLLKILKMPVAKLLYADQIVRIYKHAYNAQGSCLIVEKADLYAN